jgi:G:T-mismatch repair DNA endonuclease (very short patch repair protein)
MGGPIGDAAWQKPAVLGRVKDQSLRGSPIEALEWLALAFAVLGVFWDSHTHLAKSLARWCREAPLCLYRYHREMRRIRS